MCDEHTRKTLFTLVFLLCSECVHTPISFTLSCACAVAVYSHPWLNFSRRVLPLRVHVTTRTPMSLSIHSQSTPLIHLPPPHHPHHHRPPRLPKTTRVRRAAVEVRVRNHGDHDALHLGHADARDQVSLCGLVDPASFIGQAFIISLCHDGPASVRVRV